MKTYSIQYTAYAPAEVETITGVSVALQRNWRRRGYLPLSSEGKHARFSPSDLGYLLALKTFSDAGVSINQVRTLATMAALPVSGYVGFLYADQMNEPMIASMTSSDNPGVGRYVVMIGDKCLRVATLALLDQFDEKENNDVVKNLPHHITTSLIIFDCLNAAMLIHARAPRPVVTLLTEHVADTPPVAERVRNAKKRKAVRRGKR
jgi:DNA-binding transcriptional MerR regulator